MLLLLTQHTASGLESQDITRPKVLHTGETQVLAKGSGPTALFLASEKKAEKILKKCIHGGMIKAQESFV